MLVANVETMAVNDVGVIYEHAGHKWSNRRLPCGCLSAICVDVRPSNDESRDVTTAFTKINTLQSLIREAYVTKDTAFKDKLPEFQTEMGELRMFVKNQLDQYRTKHSLPTAVDFNGDDFYIKLQQGATCHSGQ